MGVISSIAVFVVIWWLVLFMVLPFGVQAIDAEDVAKGQAHGSPKKPMLIRKLLITTGVSLVLFGIFYAVAETGLISFRPSGE